MVLDFFGFEVGKIGWRLFPPTRDSNLLGGITTSCTAVFEVGEVISLKPVGSETGGSLTPLPLSLTFRWLRIAQASGSSNKFVSISVRITILSGWSTFSLLKWRNLESKPLLSCLRNWRGVFGPGGLKASSVSPCFKIEIFGAGRARNGLGSGGELGKILIREANSSSAAGGSQSLSKADFFWGRW